MKSFLRWSATVGLVGSTILGTWLTQSPQAFALPAEQVTQTLGPVPVFTVADNQGAPLVASGENNTKVAGVFISQSDAEKFIERLKKENPTLGNQVKVIPLSLAEVNELAQENNKTPDGLSFAYVPVQDQVESAKKLLTEQGQQYKGGVPLFVAKGGPDGGYLTIEQNNQEIIPFFFEQAQLQQMVARFKEQQPNLASTVKVEVVPLEGVIQTLQKSDNELLKNIMLIPSQESMKFLQSLSQTQPQNQRPNQPQSGGGSR
jgi:Tic22-like family